MLQPCIVDLALSPSYIFNWLTTLLELSWSHASGKLLNIGPIHENSVINPNHKVACCKNRTMSRKILNCPLKLIRMALFCLFLGFINQFLSHYTYSFN